MNAKQVKKIKKLADKVIESKKKEWENSWIDEKKRMSLLKRLKLSLSILFLFKFKVKSKVEIV